MPIVRIQIRFLLSHYIQVCFSLLSSMKVSYIHIPIALGLFALLLAWFGNPIFIPDSYEQIIVAECWSSGSSLRIDCDNIFPWFRPPLPSLMTTVWLEWIDGFSALLLLSWASTVMTLGILIQRIRILHIDEGQTGILFAMVIGVTGLAGLLFDLGLLADSKIIALPFVFGALSLLIAPQITRLKAVSIGALLGLAFLTRFENLLLVATGSLMILWYSRNRILNLILYCVGWIPFVGGWCWLLYQETGRITLSPRYWEPWILPLIDEMPLRWVQELYGMGVWNPPLRELALESQLSPTKHTLLSSFSWTDWMHWLDMNTLSLFAPSVVLVFIFSLILWYKDHSMRKWIIGFTWISMPSIALTLLPQGRESIFPVAYVLPMWISVWTWIGLSTGLIILRLEGLWTKCLLFFGVLGLTQLPNSINRPSNLELSRTGLTVQYWLRSYTPSNSIVLSSFETAPIVWLSDREWQEWPSPWEANQRIPRLQEYNRPVYGVVWAFDHHAWYSLSFEEKYYEPEAYFHTQQHAYIIFNLSGELATE